MWRAVIERDVGRSAVVFETGSPQLVLAFGISVAVGATRLESILASGAPFVGKGLLDAWRSGDDPFLDESSLATESARDGLGIIVTHNGVDGSIDTQFLELALSVLTENFVDQHLGCNLRAVVHEAFGVPAEFALDLGARIVPYAPEHEARLAGVPVDRKPILILTTRGDAERHPGNLILNRMYLRFTPPTCRLGPAERRLLRLALEGTPDDTVAEILEIAPRTLKKRWADVYTAMEAVTGIASGGDGGRRGVEVRRHVLRYLRQHPEELHAYDASDRRKAT